MSDLTETERKILLATGEGGGRKTGDVARRLDSTRWGLSSGRSFSLEIGRQLKALKARGLVAHLDDQKPVCWVRTAAGTAALEKETADLNHPTAKAGGF